MFNPSDMTTPYVSTIPLGKPSNQKIDKTEKDLIVRLKRHMLFKPRVPKIENISVFTDPVQVKQVISTGKAKKWGKLVERELYSIT
jgi:hypothetical protein